MSKLAFLAAAALAFGLAPVAARFGPIPGALLLVALGVALAVAASGSLSSLGIAGGALGAFAAGLCAAIAPALGGAALAGLAFAERTGRVRSTSTRRLHVAVALAAGAVAGSVSARFAAAPVALRAVSVIVAAVVVALPLLLDADDPVAHALEALALGVPAGARADLQAAAALRRSIDADLLDRKTARAVRATWTSLRKLAESRVRLERTRAAARPASAGEPSPVDRVIARVDRSIADHAAALTRAYSAVDAARAAEASLDDSAVRGVEIAGESFEHVSRAIVDDV